jgi:hypothetical protein
MTELPPEMVFEGEFDQEQERPTRREPDRFVYEWERTIDKVQYPDDRYSFTCCGTLYRATNAADITLMRQTHTALRHA